jgi:outer membrane cobalamin receptor
MDANGEVQFVQLLPGTYDASVTRSGFAGVTLRGVEIKVNRTSVQYVSMFFEGSAEEVEVVAKKDVVDTSSTSRGTVLTKEFLDRIPAGRSYQSAVQMAAGVTGGGGNPNMAGGATNENTYMLDGANITDPVTGTFSVNFNFDAIEQIEVLLGGYMPEYGVSIGGVVNLITESGTNNLEFDSSVYYQNGDWRPRMDERYASDGTTLAPTGFDSTFQSMQVASKVSGPVVRDRAWFIISYQHSRSMIANTGIPQRRDYDGHYVLAKLTVQPSSEHRFTAFMQLDPTTIDNTDQGDPYQKAEAQGRQAQGGFVAQGRWQWFLSPDVNLDTMFVS